LGGLMTAQDLISAVTVLFIIGMIWLRTRMQYSRQAHGRLQLQRAGRIYFVAAAVTLVLGWLVAPGIGRLAWPATPTTLATPMLMRVIWFLATYYIFIVVHRILKVRGVEVYKSLQSPV
jgi:hypothetical protein